MSLAKVAAPSNEAEILKREILYYENLINNHAAEQKRNFNAYSQKSINFREVQGSKYQNMYKKRSSNSTYKYLPPNVINDFSWTNRRNKSASEIAKPLNKTLSKTFSDNLQLVKASYSSSAVKFLPKTTECYQTKSLKNTRSAYNYRAPKPKQSAALIFNRNPSTEKSNSKCISSRYSLHKASLLNTVEETNMSETALSNNENANTITAPKNFSLDLNSLRENHSTFDASNSKINYSTLCKHTSKQEVCKDVLNNMETIKDYSNQAESKIQTFKNQTSKFMRESEKGILPRLLETKNNACHKQPNENNINSTISSRCDSPEIQCKSDIENTIKLTIEVSTVSDELITKELKPENELNVCNITEPSVERIILGKNSLLHPNDVKENSDNFKNHHCQPPDALDHHDSLVTSVAIKCSTPKTLLASLDKRMKTLKQLHLERNSVALSKAQGFKQTQTSLPKSTNILKSKYKLLNKNLSNKWNFGIPNHSKLINTSHKLDLSRNNQNNCEVKSAKLNIEAKSLQTSHTFKKSSCYCFKMAVASDSHVNFCSNDTKMTCKNSANNLKVENKSVQALMCKGINSKKLKYKNNRTALKHNSLIGTTQYKYRSKTSSLLHKYSLRHGNIGVKKNLLPKTSNSRYRFVKSTVHGTPKVNSLNQLKYSKKLIKKYKVVNKHSPKLTRSVSKHTTAKSFRKCLKTKYKVVNRNISGVCHSATECLSSDPNINIHVSKNCAKVKSNSLIKSLVESPSIKPKLKTFAKSFQMSLCKKTRNQSMTKRVSKYKYCASNIQKSLVTTRNFSYVALKTFKLNPINQAVRTIKTKYQIVNRRNGNLNAVLPRNNFRKKYNFKRKQQKPALFVGQHKNRAYKRKNWYTYDACRTWQPQFAKHSMLKKKATRRCKEGRYKKTNVVMIGDIPYKVLKKRMTVASKRFEAYSEKKSNMLRSPKKSTIISVRGIRFQMDSCKRTLKRLEENNLQETKPLKRIDIGGATYIQTSPGLLTKACSAQTRNLASRVLNRSIQRVWAASQKKNLTKHNTYCMFYNRFGRCNKEDKCPYIHDPSKIAICSRFLRGTCKVTDCPFSHEIVPGKMAICLFFLQGKCTNNECPYKHTTLSSEATLCKSFVRGYCSSGNQCKKAHILACPQYVCEGYCDKGSSCLWPHPPSKGKKRWDMMENNSKKLKKTREENFQTDEIQNDYTSSEVDKTGDSRYFTFGPFIHEALHNRDTRNSTDENIGSPVNDLHCSKENPQNVVSMSNNCVKIECISRLRKLPKLPAFIPLSFSDDESS